METRGVATGSVDTGASDTTVLDIVGADTGAWVTRETGGWKAQRSGVAKNVPLIGILAAGGFSRYVPGEIFFEEGEG